MTGSGSQVSCRCSQHAPRRSVRHWADGGETKLDNLVMLCRHHLRLVHEGGFAVEMNAAGKPAFTAPDGEYLPTGPDTRFRGNVVALSTKHRRDGLDIRPQTPVPRWLGERMDDSMAVEGFLQRE